MPRGSAFIFGPFHFDPSAQRLRVNGQTVPLSARSLQLLHVLVQRPGELVTERDLIKAAFRHGAAEDNSLVKAVGSLREVLAAAGSPLTIAVAEQGDGYRLTGQVERVEAPRREANLDALLTPHRGFTEGRAMFEALKRDRINAAREHFIRLVAQYPDSATMHIGLATASVLAYEATRAEAPDREALVLAESHAREARRLNPGDAEAWATLGFVLDRRGERPDAAAALARAVTLDPDNWRHQLRLAHASWGDARLTAARQVVVLLPGCAAARVLAATVLVARGSLKQAEREIDAGIAAVSGAVNRLSLVSLHLMKGLLLLARGSEREALDQFQRELALEASGHLDARECSADAWYAIGVCHLRGGDLLEAAHAFGQTLARVPGHAMAQAATAIMAATEGKVPLERPASLQAPGSVDTALAWAALRVAAGDIEGATHLAQAALADAPLGQSGWVLPVEPLLAVHRHPEAWAPVLATLSRRAAV